MMLRKLFLIILSVFCSCSSGDKKVLDQNEFTDYCLEQLKEKFPKDKFKQNGVLSIESSGKVFYLDNVYANYQGHPDSIEIILKNYFDSSMEIDQMDSTLSVSRIVPVIKPQAYLNSLGTMRNEKGEAPKMVYEVYNEDLVILYGENFEKGIRYISDKMLERSGIPKDSLRDIGMRNLKKMIPTLQIRADSAGSCSLEAGGIFESSMILSKTLWTENEFPVQGDLVVAIPARSLLFISGSREKAGLQKISTYAKEAFSSESYPISDQLYKWNGEKFVRVNRQP